MFNCTSANLIFLSVCLFGVFFFCFLGSRMFINLRELNWKVVLRFLNLCTRSLVQLILLQIALAWFSWALHIQYHDWVVCWHSCIKTTRQAIDYRQIRKCMHVKTTHLWLMKYLNRFKSCLRLDEVMKSVPRIPAGTF